MIVLWTLLAVTVYFLGLGFVLSLMVAAKRGDQHRGDL